MRLNPEKAGANGIGVPRERGAAAPKKPHSSDPSPTRKGLAGSVVLASVGAGEGWWEACVLEVHDDLLTLQWRDCPDEPSFVRRNSKIALLFSTL